MIDPELKIQLEQVNQNLLEIKKKSGNGGMWHAFFRGIFSALGYVAGLAIVIVILGWFLQKTGLLKPFQDQMSTFSSLINSAKKLISNDQNPTPDANNSNQPNEGTPTTVTLPNGQQIKVNLPAGY